jgi:hypothetical protein
MVLLLIALILAFSVLAGIVFTINTTNTTPGSPDPLPPPPASPPPVSATIVRPTAGPREPHQIVIDNFDLIRERQFEKAFQLRTNSRRAETPLAKLRSFYKHNVTIKAEEARTIRKVNNTATVASIIASRFRENGRPVSEKFDITVFLVLEEGSWKIDDMDINPVPGSKIFEDEASGVEAVINDPDGFTNVRRGPGAEYPVIIKIYEGQQFLVVSQNGEWWKVIYGSHSGYMHRSRIAIISGGHG